MFLNILVMVCDDNPNYVSCMLRQAIRVLDTLHYDHTQKHAYSNWNILLLLIIIWCLS